MDRPHRGPAGPALASETPALRKLSTRGGPAVRQQVVTIAMKDKSPGQLDVALSRAAVFEAAPV
jgi:hypothetical protein